MELLTPHVHGSTCLINLTTFLIQLDTSYISENQISQFGPIGFSTPRKPVLNSPHERRRNTICCYSCHCLADPVNEEDTPMRLVNTSLNSFLSSDASRHNSIQVQESAPAPSTPIRIRIATASVPFLEKPVSNLTLKQPLDSCSPSSSRLGQPGTTSFLNFSESSDDRVTPVGRFISLYRDRRLTICAQEKGREQKEE
ncbi:hypothetical protein BYT27DRAFT_6660699 [Phlegmacium glaucopus]|nr:hypothetical protein BYT27DRAFT_6660699 [Phlegmacium glaucopus]